MIAQEIVENILDKADIVEVISDYVNLKKRGTNYIGNCPFHDEKTPSFSVSSEKNIFKCFGCGMAGNVVSFLMEHEKISFPQAIGVLSRRYGIDIPRQNISDEEKKKHKEKEQIYHIYTIADNFYHSKIKDNDLVASLLKEREIPEEIAVKFHLGYAPNSNSFLSFAKSQGILEDILIKSTLIKESKKGLYDFFYDRLIFPIHSPSGRVLAFGGRLISGQGPKYLNSNDSDIYSKSEVLYGLFQSRKSIREQDECYLVEGYTDVIRLHTIGVENVVAPCGTALTQGQIDQILKYTKNIILLYDADKSGRNAMHNNAKLCVKSGCNVRVVLLPYQRIKVDLIEDHPEFCDSCELKKIDPDSFYTSIEKFIKYNAVNTFDYLMLFAEENFSKAINTDRKHQAITNVCDLLVYTNSMVRDLYLDQISKKYKVKLKVMNDYIKSIEDDIEEKDKKVNVKSGIPAHIDIKQYEKDGFYIDNNCYVFSTKYGPMKGSNFVIKPLFHIYSKTDNKRLIEVTNEEGKKALVDIPSKYMIKLEQFCERMFDEGHFLFFANKILFQKVIKKISSEFRYCSELKTLGWQREGFYAFANGYFYDKFVPVDEHGIMEFKNQKFFSPAFSSIYKDVREDDDEYENDRYFIYKNTSIDFSTWCKHIVKVYKDHGIIGISYVLAALFRDIIFNKFKFFPHLYLFAQPQSGKTTFGYSLTSIFFQDLKPFNLSSGTNVGFFRRNARYKNALAWYDEFSGDIDIKRFEALKSAYDGVGHEKGRMTKDNRSEVTKVNSACLISGQHLPTGNDGALLQRSLLEILETRGDSKPFTSEEAEALRELQDFESQGLSGIIIEILKYRKLVENSYTSVFTSVYNELKSDFVNNQRNYSERLLNNYTCILAVVKLFKENTNIDFGFELDYLFEMAKKKIEELSNMVTQSDYLASFWNLLLYMLENNQIERDVDFIIKEVFSIKVRINRNEEKTLNYYPQKKLLFLRLTKIHPLYLELHRKQFGQTGVQLSSLLHYLSNHGAYQGNVKSIKFDNSVTSAYAFDYDKLDINLERFLSSAPPSFSDNNNAEDTSLIEAKDDDLPF